MNSHRGYVTNSHIGYVTRRLSTHILGIAAERWGSAALPERSGGGVGCKRVLCGGALFLERPPLRNLGVFNIREIG